MTCSVLMNITIGNGGDFAVGRENVVERGLRYKIQARKGLLGNFGDIVEGNQVFEVGGHRDFVGGVEGAGGVAAAAQGFEGEREAGEARGVRGFEGEAAEGGEVEFFVAYGEPAGEAEGEADGFAHIRAAELGDDGPVHEFYHRVDDGVGVDDDVDLVGFEVEEPFGFDDFEAFVHHRGGVDGDFGAHIPVGVFEGLGGRGARDFLPVPGAEGAAGGGEVHFFDGVLPGAEEALEDGGVFGVDGQDDAAVFARGLRDDGAGGDEGFFVGEGDDFAGLEGGEGGPEAAEADHRADDDVDAVHSDEVAEAVDACPDFDAVGLEGFVDGFVAGFVADDDVGRVKLDGLPDQQVGAAAGGEEDDLEQVAVLPDDVQRLGADGSGGSEDGYLSFHLETDETGGVEALSVLPQFEVEVVRARLAPGAAHEGDRGAGLDGVAGRTEELLVISVDAKEVVAVLDEDDVALFGVPSREDDRAVEDGADDAARGGGDVDARVDYAVVCFGHHAFERGEEVHSFDGEVAFGAGSYAELFFFLDGLLEEGVAARQLSAVFVGEVAGGVGVDEAVEVDGGVAREDAAQALGVEVPAGDGVFQGVDLDGVGDGLAARVGVGVARDGGAERGEGEQQVGDEQQGEHAGDDAIHELRPVEVDGAKRVVGLIVDERQPELLRDASRILSSHTFDVNLP